eukprot:789044-Amphidinium_carterae.1
MVSNRLIVDSGATRVVSIPLSDLSLCGGADPQAPASEHVGGEIASLFARPASQRVSISQERCSKRCRDYEAACRSKPNTNQRQQYLLNGSGWHSNARSGRLKCSAWYGTFSGDSPVQTCTLQRYQAHRHQKAYSPDTTDDTENQGGVLPFNTV